MEGNIYELKEKFRKKKKMEIFFPFGKKKKTEKNGQFFFAKLKEKNK